ncbi:MAG: leucine-rich repeat domain-containing protein [Parachlamydiales bacterium]|nr:leucine-rich repeat domain-containing protein [Parachlamydiales bacterium]
MSITRSSFSSELFPIPERAMFNHSSGLDTRLPVEVWIEIFAKAPCSSLPRVCSTFASIYEHPYFLEKVLELFRAKVNAEIVQRVLSCSVSLEPPETFSSFWGQRIIALKEEVNYFREGRVFLDSLEVRSIPEYYLQIDHWLEDVNLCEFYNKLVRWVHFPKCSGSDVLTTAAAIRRYFNDPSNQSRCAMMQQLDLSRSSLTRMPREITCFSLLEDLNISGNYLWFFPESLGSLEHLKTLDASENELCFLPEQVWEWKQLTVLNLFKNRISSLSDKIGSLPLLEKLNLGRNCLETLPSSIGSLKRLRILKVFENELSSISEEIQQLRSLEVLDISQNQLNNLPNGIKNLRNLHKLVLSFNPIKNLPEIDGLSNLQKLDIAWTEIVSLLGITRLLQLRKLNISGTPVEQGFADGMLQSVRLIQED